jgi:cytochrome c556
MEKALLSCPCVKREHPMKKRLATAASLVALATTVAFAGPVEDRQAIMKGVAAATKTAVGMAKGETPYDDAKAKQVFQVYVNAAAKMPTLFPAGTDKGETTASPKIWDDMTTFKAGFAKLGTDAEAAMAASVDQASFGKALGVVTKNCGTCHETFRIKKG